LAAAQGRVGVAVGGEAGARLLQHLGMPTSGDTVLRLIRRLPLPRHPVPRVLGVGDWARRKGQTHGTILVDLERRQVVDLLPDRSAPTLADWLRRHRGIRTIARDRSTEYARGIGLGAPRAVQVADRWHLLLNLRQMAERWLAGGKRQPILPITHISGRERRNRGSDDGLSAVRFVARGSDAGKVGTDGRQRPGREQRRGAKLDRHRGGGMSARRSAPEQAAAVVAGTA
jgi:hypothetical protein